MVAMFIPMRAETFLWKVLKHLIARSRAPKGFKDLLFQPIWSLRDYSKYGYNYNSNKEYHSQENETWSVMGKHFTKIKRSVLAVPYQRP